MPFHIRKTSYQNQFKDFKAPDVNEQFNLEIEHHLQPRQQSPPLEKKSVYKKDFDPKNDELSRIRTLMNEVAEGANNRRKDKRATIDN